MSPSMLRIPWRLGDEMLRVTRPGGYYPRIPWLGPFGHEMGLTYYLGGARGDPIHPQTRPSTEEQLRIVAF